VPTEITEFDAVTVTSGHIRLARLHRFAGPVVFLAAPTEEDRMGFLDDLKDLVGSTVEWTVEAGGKVWEVAFDIDNWTVAIAGEIWRAIPGELLAPGLGPLAGVLKNEFEDDLFMLAGPSGVVAGLGLFPVEVDQAAQIALAGAALIPGVLKHREMNDEEWAMARWMFGGQLPPRPSIRLTNLGPIPVPFRDDPEAIVFPAIANQYYVNMGNKYFHKSSIKDGPLLMHELTHVWQGRNKLIRDLQIFVAAKDANEYNYSLGMQWKDYGLEQQGEIVEDFASGTIERGKAPATPLSPLSLNSPLFRYIYSNLRRNNNGARSFEGTSIRALTNEPTKTLRLSDIHPPAPKQWW
jgi:hypothetical protein